MPAQELKIKPHSWVDHIACFFGGGNSGANGAIQNYANNCPQRSNCEYGRELVSVRSRTIGSTYETSTEPQSSVSPCNRFGSSSPDAVLTTKICPTTILAASPRLTNKLSGDGTKVSASACIFLRFIVLIIC